MRLLLFLVAFSALAQDPANLEAVVETPLGEFRIEFAPAKAPQHVAQFLKLAREGYYDGSAFFRLFPGGIIQGGDPVLKDPKAPRARWGTGGLNLLPDEFSDYPHAAGTVSAVRIPGKPDSGGTQFFICISPQPPLDGKYSAFGRVNEGLDVIDAISRVPVNADNIADEPLRIHRIRLEPKKLEPFLDSPAAELKRTVLLRTTVGDLKLETRPDWAPETVRNFLKLVATGWYDRTGFHRLAKDFVLQGGMPNWRATGTLHRADRWVRSIPDEFRPDVLHEPGILSMAHGDEPNSAETSFFIMLGPAPHLDGKFAAFARITEGLDLLPKINALPVNGEQPIDRLELIEARILP
jgi:cyclophilin family peptidyl-prolyl cis-trans isomerase